MYCTLHVFQWTCPFCHFCITVPGYQWHSIHLSPNDAVDIVGKILLVTKTGSYIRLFRNGSSTMQMVSNRPVLAGWLVNSWMVYTSPFGLYKL